MVQTKKASEETICDQKMLGGNIVLGGAGTTDLRQNTHLWQKRLTLEDNAVVRQKTNLRQQNLANVWKITNLRHK